MVAALTFVLYELSDVVLWANLISAELQYLHVLYEVINFLILFYLDFISILLGIKIDRKTVDFLNSQEPLGILEARFPITCRIVVLVLQANF